MKFYKLIVSLLIFFFSCSGTILLAQNNSITGRIVDQETGEVIEYASVSVYTEADSALIDGTITDDTGVFIVKRLPKDAIYIVAQFLGYSSYQSTTFVPSTKSNLGDCTLSLNQLSKKVKLPESEFGKKEF